MSDRKPLVLAPDPFVPADGSVVTQQLQPGDDLDIPLAERVERLELLARELMTTLISYGINMPASAFSFLEGVV